MVDTTNIIWATVWFVVMSGFFGTLAAVADKIFAPKTDPRIETLTEMLPGANCGGCGYTGCAALAAAIVTGQAPVGSCPVGGSELTDAIAVIMGVADPDKRRYRAQVMCSGTNDLARHKYQYMGIHDCVSASRLGGGDKTCPNGCLGLGTCAKNCKFGAIHIENGVAAVDYTKCKACSACTTACPKRIIKLIPFDSTHWVGCMSVDKGAVARKYCDVSCIACKLCEKACPHGAVHVTDFVAAIDYDKCTGCGKCEAACPRRIIWSDKSQIDDGIIRTAEDMKATENNNK